VNAARVALVTGDTGFVGGSLARRLPADGSETYAIVRPSSNATILGDVLGSGNVHVHDGSTVGLIDILRSVHPDIVFHLASLVVAEHSTDDVDPFVQSNVLFGTQLLEAVTAGANPATTTPVARGTISNGPVFPAAMITSTCTRIRDTISR